MTHDPALTFLQRLIQTPSPSGGEYAVAEMVLAEMRALGYDEAWMDEAGNVVGLIRGRGEVPAVLFNTHLDHVDPGDPAAWPAHGQPYSGAIHEGAIWGRGTVDIKGPLVAQLYGVARLVGERPPGDVYVSAVVQEEVDGLGARFLARELADKVALVVMGEPGSNEIRRGHRGRSEVIVHVRGRSVHASVPEKGANPLYVIANLIQRLPTLKMQEHPEFGRSSSAPTLIRTDQSSPNVTPGEVWLTLDWRNIPGESAADACAKVRPLLELSLIEGTTGEVYLEERERRSFTGYTTTLVGEDNPAYSLPADHPAVLAAADVLGEVFGREIPVKLWDFATDGGHFAKAGMAVIGFGPGDEHVIHTTNEHLPLDEWRAAMDGNERLAREWPTRFMALLLR